MEEQEGRGRHRCGRRWLVVARGGRWERKGRGRPEAGRRLIGRGRPPRGLVVAAAAAWLCGRWVFGLMVMGRRLVLFSGVWEPGQTNDC